VTAAVERVGLGRAVLLVAAVGLLAYSNSFDCAFHYDDKVVLIGEPSITGFAPEPSSRRFLGDLSFAISYRLFGERPAGYHAVNLTIHLLNGVLVFLLVRALWRAETPLRSAYAHRAEPIALLTALLFVAHPLQTQAVTYIVQRYAALAAAFFLLSIWSYVRFRLAEAGGRAWGWYLLFLASAGAAFWTKENTAVLPLVVAGVELTFFRAPLRRRALFFAPFLAALAIGAIWAAVAGVSLAELDRVARVDTSMPRSDYLLTQARVVATYLRLLVLPVGQNLDHDVAVSTSIADVRVLLAMGLHALIVGASAWALRRGSRGEGLFALAGFGGIWFYASQLVESSFIPIVDVMYEHRAYLPSFGVFLAAAAALAALPQLSAPRRWWAVGTVLVGVLASLTFARNRVWKDDLTLWADAAAKSPGKSRPLNNYGIALFERGDLTGALAAYRRAIAVDPANDKPYFNVGEALQKAGDCEGAIPYYQHFAARHASYPDTFRNLAACFEKVGRFGEAGAMRAWLERLEAERAGRALAPYYR
jgi:tetratricopeptide (TPR) repeat protein